MAYTFVQQEGQTYYYSSSVLYVLAGILICVLPLLGNNDAVLPTGNKSQFGRVLRVLFFGFLAAFFAFHVHVLIPLYHQIPISPKVADMLPVIKLACNRLLTGQPVYAPTDEIWIGTVNAYLPMMWLPYVPAQIFGYDMRWTTVTLLFVSLFIAALPVFKAKYDLPVFPTLFAGISLFLALNYFLTHGRDFWSMTEEGVVAAFYVFLAFALIRGNYYLIGIAMGFCVLSRYALIPWIPTYLTFIFLTQPRKEFRKLFFTLSVIVLIVFIIPYFIWDPFYFLSLPGIQLKNVDPFWRYNGLTDHTFFNVGLYKFFTIETARLMGNIGLLTSFIAPAVFILFAQKFQKRYSLNGRYIGFGSLKLSLIFFYNFLPMPFSYLFFPLTLISYALLFDFISAPSGTETAAPL